MDGAYTIKRTLRSPPLLPTTPTTTSSRPVGIPIRNHRNRENAKPHKGIPPAVAALLAVTTIPPPASRKSKSTRRRKRAQDMLKEPKTPPTAPVEINFSIAEELEIGSQDDSWRSTSKAALELLLSPPEEDDLEDTRLSRTPSEELLSVRSDSCDSVPSLETDNESTFSYDSSGSHPWTPRRRTGSMESRSRIIASPPEECDNDHPLLFAPTAKPAEATENIASDDIIKRVTGRLNFKSNLTASIRVLRSAAKSFSSFTASALQSEDYITRSILSISPQYTDERRPRYQEVPTPAVRRYLNPWAATYDDDLCVGAVQMQTYSSSAGRKSRSYSRRAAPEVEAPAVRQREIRENSDFLRVIVLEMNMRRSGKLSETAPGKARLVLPPRQPTRYRSAASAPNRWKPWTATTTTTTTTDE